MDNYQLSYDIGETVSTYQIKCMTKFIEEFGFEAFNSAVFNGAFGELSMAYIHPCDKMRVTDSFEIIQRAFINAYV
jgi:hypothetical protein